MERRKAKRTDSDDTAPPRLPRIVLPPYKPLTKARAERRRRVIQETLRLREELGPLSFSAVDLVRAERDRA